MIEGTIFIKNRHQLFLVLILLTAVFFRLWKLDQVPPGIQADEAINALDGIAAIENNEIKVFFENNYGREAPFIYLVGLSAKLIGENNIWAARLPSVFFGVLGVLGIYFLAKELFDREVGLFAGSLLAISFWHIIFSRIAFRAIMVPAITAFAFYFLLIGFRQRKISLYVLGGALLGFGFYSYISYRIMPFVLIGFLPFFVYKIFQDRENKKLNLIGTALFFLTAIIVVLPLGQYFLNNPNMFWSRINSLSVTHLDNPLGVLLRNLFYLVQMFTNVGDVNPRHNVPGRPIFTLPEGIIFWTGLMAIVMMIFQGIKEKNCWGIGKIFLVLLLWTGNLFVSAFSVEGNPHFLRTIGAVIPTYIIAAYGLKLFLLLLKKFTAKIAFQQILLIVVLAGMMLWVAGANFQAYFIEYGSSPETYEGFLGEYVEIGKVLNNLPDDTDKIVLLDALDAEFTNPPLPHIARVIEFILISPEDVNFTLSKEMAVDQATQTRKLVIIPLVPSSDWVEIISEQTGLDVKERYSDQGLQIIYFDG